MSACKKPLTHIVPSLGDLMALTCQPARPRDLGGLSAEEVSSAVTGGRAPLFRPPPKTSPDPAGGMFDGTVSSWDVWGRQLACSASSLSSPPAGLPPANGAQTAWGQSR